MKPELKATALGLRWLRDMAQDSVDPPKPVPGSAPAACGARSQIVAEARVSESRSWASVVRNRSSTEACPVHSKK